MHTPLSERTSFFFTPVEENHSSYHAWPSVMTPRLRPFISIRGDVWMNDVVHMLGTACKSPYFMAPCCTLALRPWSHGRSLCHEVFFQPVFCLMIFIYSTPLDINSFRLIKPTRYNMNKTSVSWQQLTIWSSILLCQHASIRHGPALATVT